MMSDGCDNKRPGNKIDKLIHELYTGASPYRDTSDFVGKEMKVSLYWLLLLIINRK